MSLFSEDEGLFEVSLATVDREGIHPSSPEIVSKLKKKNLSPSLITGIEKCPASWFGDSFVVRELGVQEKDNPAIRGNLFHTVMEKFFALEPDERTLKAMREIVQETSVSKDYSELCAMPGVMDWLRECVNNYYKMGARPEKLKIATIEDEGKSKKGLEVFVKGKIGETSRPVIGFIDRLTELDDGSLVIEDWKTGTKAKRWKSTTKSDEGLPEARQQILYSWILRDKGHSIKSARLIYPMAKEIVNVDLNDKVLNDKVYDSVHEADSKLSEMIEKETFEYKPSHLCAWCPLAKICPEAMIRPYDKMQTAYASQPEPDILRRGFDVV